MKGSDYIIDFLAKKGINHMFGYPGAVVCHLMDSAYKHKEMELHLNYHEQASAFAACGFSMSTGKPSVAYANGGPGMTNLVTGIADAWYDSLPVIFIVGQVDTDAMCNELPIRQRGIQEIPSAKIVKEIVKYSETVSEKSRLRYCIERAYHEATSGRRGPVLLEIPADVQRADIDIDSSVSFVPTDTSVRKLSNSDRDILMESISAAKRPCFIIGNGVKISGNYIELRKIADQIKIPILSTLPALDCLPFDHPMNFGFVGNNGNRYSNFILGKADLIVSIGCRMDVKVVGNQRNSFAKNAGLIRIDIDANELTYKVRDDEISILASAESVFHELVKMKIETDYSSWIKACKELKKKFYGYDFRNYHLLLQTILNRPSSTSCFTMDVGQHEIYSLQALQLKDGQKIAISSGLASMGFGIPSAIGAHYATGKHVVCVCGDGGFLMNVQELQYIGKERIPVKVVVFNNNALGMIREFQNRNFEGKCVHSVEAYGYNSPNIKAITESYEIDYIRAEKIEDISPLVMDSNEPVVVELIINEPTELYPRFRRGFPVQEMIPELPKEIYEWAMGV